jgi:hypothetical protein
MTIDSARSQGRAGARGEPAGSEKSAATAPALPSPPLVSARPKERRRPMLIAAMVALVCAGGLISAYAYVYPDPAVSLSRLIVTFR